MKKSFFVLGVAVAALASCTNEEVVDMPQSRAIQFGTFVNHSTRGGVTETTDKNLTKFFVFGSYDDSWTPVYSNVLVEGGSVGTEGTVWNPTQTAYWIDGKKYRFGAYSDGENSNNSVSFSASERKLTFENYTVDNKKDLIVAIPEEKTAQTSDNAPVELSFYHMLSQVKFTFENTDAHEYTMKISDIKVNAIKTTNVTATYKESGKPNINWTTQNVSTEDYDFGTLEDIAEDFKDNTHTTTCFVIPQSNENLEVTFTATFSDVAGVSLGTSKFKGDLTYKGNVSGTEQNQWTEGFKYNYTVEINGSTIDQDLEEQIIQFKVVEVDEWTDTPETPVTPEENV